MNDLMIFENMNNVFCTIITESHLPYARVLHHSLTRHDSEAVLNVLIVDGVSADIRKYHAKRGSFKMFHLEDLAGFGLTSEINTKYQKDPDWMRWSLKPVFIQYLLSDDSERVIYLDSDQYFFSNYDFLFNKLETHRVLLSPHWRVYSPQRVTNEFRLLMQEGLFNGGFFGAARGADDILEWWAAACLHDCSDNKKMGIYVDQGYLNVLPVYFDGVHILKHRGLNVATWNRLINRREVVNGQVLINGEYPVIFIHFTKGTIEGIGGNDANLMPYLKEYVEVCNQYGLDVMKTKGL